MQFAVPIPILDVKHGKGGLQTQQIRPVFCFSSNTGTSQTRHAAMANAVKTGCFWRVRVRVRVRGRGRGRGRDRVTVQTQTR